MFVAAEKVPAHLAKQLGLVNELAEDPVAAFVSRDQLGVEARAWRSSNR
jgi:hypothetical protein